jgi:hypothetical protein
MLFELGDVNGLSRMIAEHFSADSRASRQQCVASARERLANLFSDEVAHRRFFSLPMVVAAFGLPLLAKAGR